MKQRISHRFDKQRSAVGTFCSSIDKHFKILLVLQYKLESTIRY